MVRFDRPNTRPIPGTATPGLAALQRWLAAQILAPDGPPAQALDELITRPPAGDLVQRLALYRDCYPARIESALTDTYPALIHLIGAGACHALAHRYARFLAEAPPPHSYNLNDAGDRLPSFLVGDALAADLPFLPDLARLEWAVAVAFHTREREPFDTRTLASWSFDDFACTRLRFQASLAVVRSAWPIVELWEARETPVAEIDLDLRDCPQVALVHRRGLDVVCRVAEPLEADCLERLCLGQLLGDVAAFLEGCGAEGAMAGWFAAWSTAGLIVDCVRAQC